MDLISLLNSIMIIKRINQKAFYRAIVLIYTKSYWETSKLLVTNTTNSTERLVVKVRIVIPVYYNISQRPLTKFCYVGISLIGRAFFLSESDGERDCWTAR